MNRVRRPNNPGSYTVNQALAVMLAPLAATYTPAFGEQVGVSIEPRLKISLMDEGRRRNDALNLNPG